MRRDRAGFTLLELVISMALLLVVLTTALTLFADQMQVFQRGTERLVLLQNLSYASSRLEQDLRAAGTGAVAGQPHLVFAGEDAVAFNADYTTNVEDDPFAVYFDPDAESGQVAGLLPPTRIGFPGSSFGYPDSAHLAPGGSASPAETILLYFEEDTGTVADGDYVLYRRVNAGEPERIARALERIGDGPFFRYFERLVDANGVATVEEVSPGLLPLAHVWPLHRAPGDTGAVARIDRVRAVRFQFAARSPARDAERRSVTRLVRLENAGVEVRGTCGDHPLLGAALTAEASTTAAGEPVVRLAWPPAVDESGGERDVVRYVLWRRDAGASGWPEPLLSIPAGLAIYEYSDTRVTAGASYEYALAAQDCTPSLSDARALAGPVTLP